MKGRPPTRRRRPTGRRSRTARLPTPARSTPGRRRGHRRRDRGGGHRGRLHPGPPGSPPAGFARASVRGLTIRGGPIGIEFAGFPDDELLVARDSIIRDQTVASVRAVADGSGAWIDLGNGGEPGGNQLSVASGVAILDARENPFPNDEVIDCRGITLNGRAYQGLVEGPAESLPDYQILGDGMLRF